MAKFKVTFTLDDEDAKYFRSLYKKAKRGAKGQDSAAIVREARGIVKQVRSNKKTPRFVIDAIDVLADLTDLVQDEEYAAPKKVRDSVLAALAYFSNPDDLIPDDIPGLGFLDDAIMIKFVEDEFQHELWGYRRFRKLRMASSLSVKPFDQPIRESGFNTELWFNEGTALDHAFEAGDLLGSSLIQVGGALATYGIGNWIGKPGVAELGRDLVRAQLVTQGVTQLLKYSVGRMRPDGSSQRSFPSGHASGVFASATVLNRHYGWKVGLPAFGVASYVAASRLSENKHYLSDVVFGAAIGLTAVVRSRSTRGPHVSSCRRCWRRVEPVSRCRCSDGDRSPYVAY